MKFARESRRALQFFGALAVAGSALATRNAAANERRFTYSYETAVLPEGARELEVWTTWRGGRSTYYSRFDHRIEFEVGLTPKLQTSFYINFSGRSERDPQGGLRSSFDYQGISNEWKYKLSDPVADAIGFALYGELGFAGNEIAVETKALFDKRVGDFLFVANLVGELELESESEDDRLELSRAYIAEASVGGTYFFSPTLSAGLEAWNATEIAHGAVQHSALFAGPVLAYSHEGWWAALTAMRQLPALKRSEDHGTYVFDGHESYNVRLLFSFHL